MRPSSATAAASDRSLPAPHASEERFHLLERAFPGMVYDWDVPSGRLHRSQGLEGLLGFDPDEVPAAVEWWVERVHPEDLPAARQHYIQAFTSGQDYIEAEYRIRHRDGRWVDLWDRGHLVRDACGRVVQAIGHVLDITARKQVERALRQYRDWLELGTAAAHMGLFDWDLREQRLRVTAELAALYGVEPDAFDRGFDAWTERLHPEDQRSWQNLEARFARGETDARREFRIVRPDGEIRWLEMRARISYGFDGRPVRITGANIDITERKLADERLKAADQRKDQFLAMLAHELRNPLAPLINASRLLELFGQGDPRLKKTSEMIGRQVDHMARLIDDLLDVSRVTQGKILLKKQVLELAPVIYDAVDAVRTLIDARSHQLNIALPAQPVRVEADATRFAQIIGNLLDNAAKYTEEGGQIHLEVQQRERDVVIRVRDNGMGIAPDLLPRVFELFTQDERGLDRAKGGLGIGLALVKNLVELHGGTVHAASKGPGRGSEFSVRLPLAGPQEPSAPASELRGKSTGSHRNRVLVVDDNVDAAETLGIMLEMEGHEVATAFDGPQALALVPQFRPDVALLDIGMPGMDGYELAERLRELPEMQHAVLIAVTGYGQSEDRERSRRAGFDHHLVKPVEPQRLATLLASLRG